MKGRLSLLDCLALGINGVVGSGIFLLPGRLAAAAGPSSILAFLACGLICILIALCFAEAAGMFERSGGPFLYATAAFGEPWGYGVGWMSLCTGVVGYAAVSRGLATQLGKLVPAFTDSGAQAAFAAGLILTLGAINLIGLKAGARTSDAFSAVKVLPLLAFVALGLLHLRTAHLRPFWPADAHGFAQAIFIAVFACSGFEYVSVPAGEAEKARSDIPKAIVGALAGATLLYALVQLAAVGAAPGIAGSARPLADATESMVGPWGGTAVAVAAIVSMAGFCASSALVGPRLICAFAEDGILPARVARTHPRLGTPVLAIALGCGLSAGAAYALDFDKLVDISNVALFAQYLPTCLAVMVLRRTRPTAPRAYRLPWGDLIPVLAVAASIAMLGVARPARAELIASAATLAVGYALYGLRRWAAPRGATAGSSS